MRIIDSLLYIEYPEMIASGIKYIGDKWPTIKDPQDRRKLLIAYEPLKQVYKDLIIAKFGDPYQYVAASVIKQRLTIPEADKKFITSYTLPDGTQLPHQKQRDYLAACGYLHLLSTISPRAVRSLGFARVDLFNNAVLALIKGDGIGLPRSYAKLKAKVRQYKHQGADCLIHKGWCNGHAKKVKDEICESVLLEMICHSNQFEDTIVAHRYNKWVDKHNAELAAVSPLSFGEGLGVRLHITDSTVGRWRRKHQLTTTQSRIGQKSFHNEFTPVIRRQRPTHPLYLINADDNRLDLYFKTNDSKFARVTLIVVTDAFNDYPLGWSIGTGVPTSQLVKDAFLNAVHHVRDLTGEWLWAHQIQTDSFDLKNLRPFYEAQATFTPTRVGNARAKTIERSFGTSWHQVLKCLPNYSGPNITAAHAFDPEISQKNAKLAPPIEQAPQIVEEFINVLRTRAFETGKRQGRSLRQEWLEAYRNMPHDAKKPLSIEKRLLVFGRQHTHLNTVTNAGLTVTISGKPIHFDIPQQDYLKHVGRKIQVYYDPYDFSFSSPFAVLATADDARIQFLCPVNEPMKMAIADMKDGDREKINLRIAAQRQVGQYALNAQELRRSILSKNNIELNALLGMNKQDRYIAESSMTDDYLNQLTEGNSEAPVQGFGESLPPPPPLGEAGRGFSPIGGGREGADEVDVYDLMIQQEEGRL